MGKDIYTVGVSQDGPYIGDGRFNVIPMDKPEGLSMLKNGSIDMYVDGETAVTRTDTRSQYAAGALKQYLEKSEITRLINQNDINRTFPLRIEVDYIAQTGASAATPYRYAGHHRYADTGRHRYERRRAAADRGDAERE